MSTSHAVISATKRVNYASKSRDVQLGTTASYDQCRSTHNAAVHVRWTHSFWEARQNQKYGAARVFTARC